MKTGQGHCPSCGSSQFEVEFDAQNRPGKARCYYNRCSPRAILAALFVTIDSSLLPEKRDQNKSFINLKIIEDLISVYGCLICARVPAQFAHGSAPTKSTSRECVNGYVYRRCGPPSYCKYCGTDEV